MSGKDTKKRIHKAASDLFYEKGYDETSVAEIIELSKSNKGSFYYHFEGKPHLGYNVYQDMFKGINDSICELFPSLSAIEKLFLQECLFWRLFFSDENIRRFSSELFKTVFIELKTEYFDAILDLSTRDFPIRELLMIQGVELSLRCWFVSYVYKIVGRLKEKELVSFYLRHWLSLYEIPTSTVDSYLKKAFKQLSKLSITNEGFTVFIARA